MQLNLTMELGDPTQAKALAALLATLHPGLEFGERVTFLDVGDNPEPDPRDAFTTNIQPPDPASAFMPPEAGVPMAPANPGGLDLDLDGEGLPWDARIHATTEGGGGTKTNAGMWRAKRNVDPEERAKVVAELKAAMGAPAPAATPVQEQAPAAPPPPPPPPSGNAGSAPPPPPPASVENAAPSSAGGPAEFARIMRKVTELQTAGKVTAEHTNAAVQAVGLQSLRDLLTRSDLIPAFEQTLDTMAEG